MARPAGVHSEAAARCPSAPEEQVGPSGTWAACFLVLAQPLPQWNATAPFMISGEASSSPQLCFPRS